MFSFVIEKRERELVEIGKGLDSLFLLKFFCVNKVILLVLFLREEERRLNVSILKGKIIRL